MKDTKQYIYKIITSDATGTGFKVAGYPFLITNYHIIAGNKQVAIENHDKDRFLGNVVMVNTDLDLAFINIKELEDTNSSIILDENLNIKAKQQVFIHGFPFGMPFTVTEGIISSPRQRLQDKTLVQTDAAMNAGNSGGPMLTENGTLIGVSSSNFTNAENVGFGILHTDVIKQIQEYTFKDNIYRVRCNSCDNFIIKKTTFCDSCGNEIDESVFDELEKSYFTKIVEKVLSEELKINPVLCRAGADEYWEFHKGSALIRIFINNHYIHIISPINKLPEKNLNELLTYLTSENMFPYMLGVQKNKIYISYSTYKEEIYYDKKNRFKKHIKELALKADELDDLLKNKFGCEKADESKKIEE